MNKRLALEFGFLAAGLAIGIGFVLLRHGNDAEPATPEDLPVVSVLWQYRAGGPIISSPVVVDGRLYVGSHDDSVHCIDVSSGEAIWTFSARDDVEAAPLVVDGRVYVGSASGKLHAIDAATGEAVWTYETGDRILGGATFFRPAEGPALVLVGSYDRKLHAVTADSGEGRWTVETDNYVNGTPAVSGDAAVFGGCDGLLRIVDARTGASRRVVTLGEDIHIASSAIVDGGVAYVAHVFNRCEAVDVASGEVLWTYQAEDSYFSSPAIATDRVVIGGRDRTLRALDRSTGEPLWAFACRDVLDATPTIAGDRVLVGSGDGRLYAVGLADGLLIFEYAFGGAISGRVAVIENRVYVGSEDGLLTALRMNR